MVLVILKYRFNGPTGRRISMSDLSQKKLTPATVLPFFGWQAMWLLLPSFSLEHL